MDPELLRRLLRAKDRIAAAPHEEWPVSRLARVSGVSEAHFARSFKDAFGVPPHRYLLTCRIERAAALLRDTELPILEIALATGWKSLGTFGRTFRDVTGTTPKALRAREKAAPHDLESVPGCILHAAHRPDLTIAVFGEAAPRGRRYERPRHHGGPMSEQGVQVVGLYVHDQDEALKFYVDKLGFKVHTDARNGGYRWLTVQHPEQPSFQLGLCLPQEPIVDAATAKALREAVAKGMMPPLVLVVADVKKSYEAMKSKGVEFTQEPVARFGSVDAGFRDPSGNGWKLVQAR